MRLFIEENQWSCFCLSHQFHFEPPCHNHYPVNHNGYIATRLSPHRHASSAAPTESNRTQRLTVLPANSQHFYTTTTTEPSPH